MKQSVISELVLYRYRYIIGYGLFFILLVGLLIVAGFFIPGGITKAEQASAVASMNISLSPPFSLPTVDLPYHLLQKASISLFGLHEFTIKLPSLILGLVSSVALLFLLRAWFRPNIALLSGIVAITASQFLIISQSGTPTINLFLWSVVLLLSATYISHAKRHGILWKTIFSVTAALSLYTPLSIYIIGAMLVSALLHPHLRSVLKNLSKTRVLISSAIGLILLIPLMAGLVREPTTTLTLLGLDKANLSLGTLWLNAQSLFQSLLGFTQPTIGPETITPLYGFSAVMLMLLGLLRVAADHHSARTYALAIWLIPLTFILLFQPNLTAIAFVPFVLLLAIGIETLTREWYSLFPQNPYARIAALIPLTILIAGIAFTGVARYQNSFRYHPDVAKYFSNDLSLARGALSSNSQDAALVVPKNQKEFYSFLNREYPNLIVTSKSADSSNKIISSYSVPRKNLPKTAQLQKIVVNHYSKDSLRFYIYKSNDWE